MYGDAQCARAFFRSTMKSHCGFGISVISTAFAGFKRLHAGLTQCFDCIGNAWIKR